MALWCQSNWFSAKSIPLPFIVLQINPSGFFELFSRNFNCLSFDCLDKEHYQLNFHKELNKLKKNKIFFENGISASKHINNLLKKKHNIDFNNKNFSKNNSSFIRKYANFDKVNLEQIDKILNRWININFLFVYQLLIDQNA